MARLLWRAPYPVWVLLFGLPPSLVVGVASWVHDGAPSVGVVVFIGSAYGLTGGTAAYYRQRELRIAAAPIPSGRLGHVLRAAARGPAPVDDPVRDAARRIVVHRLARQKQMRASAVVVLGAIVLLLVSLAITVNGWLAVLALAMVLLIANEQILLPRRLRQRAQVLRPPSWT